MKKNQKKFYELKTRDQRLEMSERNFCDPWDSIKQSNIHMFELQKREWAYRIFEKYGPEDFQNGSRSIPHRSGSSVNPKEDKYKENYT